MNPSSIYDPVSLLSYYQQLLKKAINSGQRNEHDHGDKRLKIFNLYQIYRVFKEKVLLRFCSITFNQKRPESKLIMSKIQGWLRNISKNQIVWKSMNGKNQGLLNTSCEVSVPNFQIYDIQMYETSPLYSLWGQLKAWTFTQKQNIIHGTYFFANLMSRHSMRLENTNKRPCLKPISLKVVKLIFYSVVILTTW